MRYLGGWPSPDPNDKREGAVRYRVGSGESVEIPPEGLDSETWYALMTLTGVEWYDARGKRCNSPPPPRSVEFSEAWEIDEAELASRRP